jgi:hypothetical protein
MPAWVRPARRVTDNNFQFQIPVGAGLPRFTPGVNFTNPAIIKLTDVGGWGHDATMHHPIVEDTLGAAKLNAKREIDGFFRDVQAGLSYSKREKSHEDVSQLYALKNNRAITTVPFRHHPADHFAGLGRHPGRADFRPARRHQPLLRQDADRYRRRPAGLGRHREADGRLRPLRHRHRARQGTGARQCRRPVRAREPGNRGQGRQRRHHHRPAAAAHPTTTSCPA